MKCVIRGLLGAILLGLQTAMASPSLFPVLHASPPLAHVSTPAATHVGQPHSNFWLTFGGKGYDAAQDIINVSSGGFLVIGRTATASGATHMYLLRLTAQGGVVWEKKIGGNESDEATRGIELPNGDFVIVGNSDSYGGGPGLKDMWVVRVDAQGNELWNKTYSHSGSEVSIDEARSIVPAHDGGFLVLGSTLSLEKESSDIFLVKISETGERQWEKTYGGDKSEEGAALVKVEGGYTLVGHTESEGNGKWDIWLLHIDTNGELTWSRTFGGGDNEMSNSLIQTSDGGYLIAGYTYSFAVASLDGWLIKTDKEGNEQWNKAFGGMSTDELYDVIETRDGNFVAAGYTQVVKEGTNGTGATAENYKVFLVKVDKTGKEVWQKSLGDGSEQRAFSVVEADDDGIVAAGLLNDAESGYEALVLKVSKSGT